MKTSPDGLRFLKGFEGLKLRPYPDAGGMSVGYGHFLLPGENASRDYTQDECDAFFAADLGTAEDCVNAGVAVDLTDAQFDALVSLTYNIGIDAFRRSTTLQRINAGNLLGGALAMLWWNKVNGKRDKVLLARRAAEVLIFTEGKYDG